MDRFRFHRPEMQAMLKRLYKAMEIPYADDDDGSLSCDDKYAYLADDLHCAVNASAFPLWYTHGTTTEEGLIDKTYRDRVRNHLKKEEIPFEEFDHNGQHWFLLEEGKEIPVSIYEDAIGEIEGGRPRAQPVAPPPDERVPSLERTMKGMEISINGRDRCTIGVGESGVLSSIVRWVDIQEDAQGISDGFGISVGGLIVEGENRTHCEWLNEVLSVGDAVTIRLVETAFPDKPVIRKNKGSDS
ncbi:hypothetical protein ACFL2Q_05650 [Thermodesulfobacteriota bacterium]